MIIAMAHGYRVLGDERFLTSARRAARFIEERMEDEGRLLATYRGGRARLKAYLDDYALLLHTVRQVMDQDRLRPELTDAELIAQLLWAGVHGVAALEITRADKQNWCRWSGHQVLSRHMIDLIFRGVLREGDPALSGTRDQRESPRGDKESLR